MIKRIFWYVCLFMSLAFVLLSFTDYRSLLPGYHVFFYTPQKYKAVLDSADVARQKLKGKYGRALVRAQQEETLMQAGKVMTKRLTENIFPFWYGTAYHFYGKTEVPGRGKIGCGYFVTTTLRDLGIPIEKNRLAQIASGEMIKELVGEAHTQTFTRVPLEDFLANVRLSGKGLYIVGLDTHTGFIFVDEQEEIWFIHASGRFPLAVVKEPAMENKTLAYSDIRVLGKISASGRLMQRWLGV